MEIRQNVSAIESQIMNVEVPYQAAVAIDGCLKVIKQVSDAIITAAKELANEKNIGEADGTAKHAQNGKAGVPGGA